MRRIRTRRTPLTDGQLYLLSDIHHVLNRSFDIDDILYDVKQRLAQSRIRDESMAIELAYFIDCEIDRYRLHKKTKKNINKLCWRFYRDKQLNENVRWFVERLVEYLENRLKPIEDCVKEIPKHKVWKSGDGRRLINKIISTLEATLEADKRMAKDIDTLDVWVWESNFGYYFEKYPEELARWGFSKEDVERLDISPNAPRELLSETDIAYLKRLEAAKENLCFKSLFL